MKIKKLRSKIAIAASLALSAGLVATGLPSAQAAGLQPTAAQLAAWKGKEITYYFYNDSQAELDTTKSQIADFEKLTGAKVKLDVIPFTSLDTQLQARLAAGNAPDVGRLNNPGLYIKDSLDLEKYLGRKYAAEFLKGSTLQVTHPTTKKLIGVPYDLTVNGPFINVDMFKKAGVAVPTSWNWTELVAAGKKVQKATGSEYAFAIDKSGHRVSTAMSHFGAYMVDKNQRNVLPTSKFRAEKAIKIITDLYKPKELNGGGWPGGKFLTAFNASKNPDLAAFFVRYLADTAQMEQMDKNAFWLPTRADLVAQGVKYANRSADMAVFQADAAKTPAAAYGIQSVPTLTGNIYNKLRDLMTEVMAGKITAKQAVQTQIDFIDAQLATLKK